MKRFNFLLIGTCAMTSWLAVSPARAADGARDYPFSPVPFTAVHFDDAFWRPRLETNRKVTLPYDFKKCEETGRISNFAKAGKLMPGAFEGIYYNDSDVYKVTEGAAYTLKVAPDPALEKYLDELIAKFAAAQEADGYLYTARTIDPKNAPKGSGPERWSYLQHSHELYNIGHMYEAAVAHYLATGKRNYLEIALKSADLIDRTFGPEKRIDPPGHQEIEIGLVKLFRVTGEARYLKLAKFFLDMRGHNHDKRASYEEYAQDQKPVIEQDRPVGHAVRAVYMFSAMADVAALTGDESYIHAIDRIWANMVGKRLYLTGGIGALHGGEAFGEDYELPNQSAYGETCAAIANCMLNHRMFLLHGDAQYIDVLERTLYNGYLSGVSLSGDRFFYVNPLASAGDRDRKEWFDCSCCPTNVVRFMPSIPGYAYAQHGRDVYVNLFVAGKATLDLPGADAASGKVTLVQETQYPWAGDVAIRVEAAEPAAFTLCVRIPGWAQGRPVPGDLYTYLDVADAATPTLTVNGEAVALKLERGYARLERTWKKGDVVKLSLPMPVRRVVANPQVQDDVGLVALERGPLVYCVEGVDHDGHVADLALSDDTALEAIAAPDLLGGVTTLRGKATRVATDGTTTSTPLTAVPYYAWCHRAQGEMLVWLPRTKEAVRPLEVPKKP